MSEANMLVKINEAITEETTFDNSGFGGTVGMHEELDDGTIICMGPSQAAFIYNLATENGIVPSQQTKFIRLAYNRIVELKKTR